MITGFGYVWSGLMAFSAVLNLVLVFKLDAVTWAAVMSAWGLGSKITLFVAQFATMRLTGAYRGRKARELAAAGSVAETPAATVAA